MPRGRPNQGPKLVPIQNKGWQEPLWYIQWTEAGRQRRQSTGTRDRGEAETIFGHWLVERDQAASDAQGARYPHEVSIGRVLAIYGENRAPELTDPKRIGQCITHLVEWWGDRMVDAIRPQTCRLYRQSREQQGAKIATAGKEL